MTKSKRIQIEKKPRTPDEMELIRVAYPELPECGLASFKEFVLTALEMNPEDVKVDEGVDEFLFYARLYQKNKDKEHDTNNR